MRTLRERLPRISVLVMAVYLTAPLIASAALWHVIQRHRPLFAFALNQDRGPALERGIDATLRLSPARRRPPPSARRRWALWRPIAHRPRTPAALLSSREHHAPAPVQAVPVAALPGAGAPDPRPALHPQRLISVDLPRAPQPCCRARSSRAPPRLPARTAIQT